MIISYKVSRFIINYALMADAGTLVIGHNAEWKKSINIGKLNNQKFVSIPHARLIEMIHYKADETGLTVIIREESYNEQR
ncbi:IS200/IS605 family accessory protein TnpB-related protein [Candidatus Regiella insecticola]|uniref:IS200/IS605 family accessory protein TnpB-related protein n=1 Tax=Candidatus Regiella insecticola TaxID=138073 RepID=UPI0002F437B3|nr:IS200/IS605 family accessory protein TnpB-related protein [Candidatus Regiella insecticola]